MARAVFFSADAVNFFADGVACAMKELRDDLAKMLRAHRPLILNYFKAIAD